MQYYGSISENPASSLLLVPTESLPVTTTYYLIINRDQMRTNCNPYPSRRAVVQMAVNQETVAMLGIHATLVRAMTERFLG
ncbi:hypothetical protein ASPZODRAFT_135820, partial [Penicilliopsis zonata CBS 506.65]